jgi:hypothetical protein
LPEKYPRARAGSPSLSGAKVTRDDPAAGQGRRPRRLRTFMRPNEPGSSLAEAPAIMAGRRPRHSGRRPFRWTAWDRFIREPLDLEYLIPRFDKAGVRFAEVDGNIDLGTDSRASSSIAWTRPACWFAKGSARRTPARSPGTRSPCPATPPRTAAPSGTAPGGPPPVPRPPPLRPRGPSR